MTKINLNGGKWYGDPKSDSLDELLVKIAKHPLDPRFEHYLDQFISRDVDQNGNSTGFVRFYGNFAEFTHAFDIRTNEEEMIRKFTEAIQSNLASDNYKQARRAAGIR
ncbi:hypothetical protein FY034_17550 (plasmid) [Trichlorobacter lovleyi]|uniref:hypothetical protein n=1 Tax=Trichlorobacter lovleyi TaxID=313985 RepID=UPI00223ECF9F|nr:hypothetical protein [Trichlorobacter lovleyi]QOX80829.1 hypothetical protein FY034_17550 [Trichlorobacter lovleyi]